VTDVRDDSTREVAATPASVVVPASNGHGRSTTVRDPARTPPKHRVPRRPREMTSTDIIVMFGCFLSAVCLVWLAFQILTQGTGWFGYLVAVFVVYLVLLYVVTADRFDSTVAIDRVMTSVVLGGAFVLLVPLVWIVYTVLDKGLTALRLGFFFKDQRGITPVMPSTAGGGAHAIIGTIEQVGLALLWSLPLALLAAVFLNESRSKWRRPVRIFVDAMSGLPSVLAGLFIYAVLILPYAKKFELFSFNGFMASLALAMIMIPTITRTVEVVLRLVPDGLREASLAMGSSRARTTWSVVLPTARTGITTAVILGIARAVGETAPLLFTAFGYDLYNNNPFKGPQESLPLFIYRNIRKPDVSAIERGFAGALVLMLIVIVLFIIARIIGRDRSKKTKRRSIRASASPMPDLLVRGDSA
jgi:phosphate transport system permease protein